MTKESDNFIKQVETILFEFDFIREKFGIWDDTWYFDTPKYGIFRIVDITCNSLYQIFGRFENEDKFELAHKNWCSNKHTGKYNFHYNTLEDCISLFIGFIKNIVTN